MEDTKISIRTRLISMLIDHMIASLFFMISFVPLLILKSVYSSDIPNEFTQENSLGLAGYLFLLFGFSLFFVKDSFKGRSIAKRILKLQIVHKSTGEAANPLRCFVRNIFIIIWPIEVVVAMINPNRRIGDRVAGTKLVVFDPSKEQEKINSGKVLLVFVLAYCLTLLMELTILPGKLKDNLVNNQVPFIESSYNPIESHETEKLLNDSLVQYFTADVKVYDKIDRTNHKYVSINFRLKANYLKNDDSFSLLAGKTTSLLFSKYDRKNFVGKLKYIYQVPGHSQERMQTFDGVVED